MVSKTQKYWFLLVVIGLGAAALFFIGPRFGASPAVSAQMPHSPDSGIMVVPVQFDRENYGIAMVDTVGQTIWIYQLNNRGPVYNRLKLLSARSWKYDKLLEQYNTAEPKPEQVKALLQNLGEPVEQPMEKQTEPNETVLKEKETDSNSSK
jgi:hypothetical protein